jgi:accessory gene regulator protein AgrB
VFWWLVLYLAPWVLGEHGYTRIYNGYTWMRLEAKGERTKDEIRCQVFDVGGFQLKK